MYIEIDTKQTLNLNQIKERHPNVSFAKNIDEATLNEFGYATVYSDPVPEGDVIIPTEIVERDGKYYQTYTSRSFTEEELLSQQQADNRYLFTFKTDFWERCTEDEAEILDAAIEEASARERRMWNDCIQLEHSSEQFKNLRDNMITLLNDEARVDEILAPSNR